MSRFVPAVRRASGEPYRLDELLVALAEVAQPPQRVQRPEPATVMRGA